jgi:hypothetical protein
MTDIPIPKLPNCKVCNHEARFAIQKSLDNGVPYTAIMNEYQISLSDINVHVKNDHRENLIAFGTMDYVIRKKAVDIGLILADYIDKWSSGLEARMPKTIRDGDVIRAMDLYLKSRGELTNKHEVTVKRSIEDALKQFLEEENKEEEP